MGFPQKVGEKFQSVSVCVSQIISKNNPCKIFQLTYRTMAFPKLKIT